MPHEAMRQLFDVPVARTDLGNMPALPAIYPKYDAPIVTSGDGQRSLIRAHWGFLTPNKSKKTGNWLKPQAWNNTRDDKIRSASLWKDSFVNRRCLVPATAYAEAIGRNPAMYHWFNVADAAGFAFAGIWRHQRGTLGETEIDAMVFSIVTTSPNSLAAHYHTRMPLVLAPDDYEMWLNGDPDEAVELLEAFPAERMQVIGEGIGMREEPE
ncbi:SOS response-associated peptidase [Oceanicola sp. D3]|uniref:SOS response-associated peptidase n=1 Tax=Oceanicola sp. D3 TaxID=2587163 RepID=UPI0020C7F9F6|nr:SOS response-associated peptidase family protein [Oceanicola sp. D3]